jgi:hypothetical protein
MAKRPVATKTFKGITYKVFQEAPNVFKIVIGSTVFYMNNEDKIDKIARHAIGQIKKFSDDGVISKSESVKIDRFISDLLKKEGVNVRTLTPITRPKDIFVGSVLIPREVDIVSNDDVMIVLSTGGNGYVECFVNTEKGYQKKSFKESDILNGYLVVDNISEDVKSYNNYSKQIKTLEEFFDKTIKSVATDINETSKTADDYLQDFVKSAIIDSKYNGFVKERLISFVEENLK